MKRHTMALGVLTVQLLVLGCESSSGQTQANSQAGVAPAASIQRVVEGVGRVKSSSMQGTAGSVFVFEEYHTSRIGQLETAVMLLRLREQQGVKTVGLEGAIRTNGALDAGWFHRVAGDGAQAARENVAVRMLGEGEISSAEALALMFADEQVYGIENAELYNREHNIQGDAAIGYLVSIAEKTAARNLSQADVQKLNRLISQRKSDEAIEMLLNSDPWTKEQYQALKQTTAENASPTSCEAMEARMRAMQGKAQQLGVVVEEQIKKVADQTIDFYESCQKRSVAMVNSLTALPGPRASTPTAMIIGAAHTDGIMKLLRERNISYTVITPNGLNPTKGSLTGEQFDRKNKVKWVRTSPGTLGRLLNADGLTKGAQEQRKPPPIIETTTAKSYASAELAGMLIAMAARDRKRVPDDVWVQIKDLPEFVPDRGSFAIVDGDDVVYRSTLKKTDGTDIIAWARVGTGSTPAAAKGLEEKLLQARADLGGGGRLPPTGPPSNSTPAAEEGPGDGKRGEIVISRIGPTSLAVFGASKADVMRVGRVSG